MAGLEQTGNRSRVPQVDGITADTGDQEVSGMRPRLLGERLMASGLITAADLERALAYKRRHDVPIGAALVDLGICDMTSVLAALVAQRDEVRAEPKP
jgi:hypothetical protein